MIGTLVRWPEDSRPETAAWHAVNELTIDASPEVIFGWLRRPELWPSYYSNARFIRHLSGPWPELAEGSQWRWLTFGVIVTSEVVECEPGQRMSWTARALGAQGYHGWVLRSRNGATLVRTEETQRGWSARLSAPVMSRLQVHFHQRWLNGLAQVCARGAPPP